jgi:hypothetical protein
LPNIRLWELTGREFEIITSLGGATMAWLASSGATATISSSAAGAGAGGWAGGGASSPSLDFGVVPQFPIAVSARCLSFATS